MGGGRRVMRWEKGRKGMRRMRRMRGRTWKGSDLKRLL